MYAQPLEDSEVRQRVIYTVQRMPHPTDTRGRFRSNGAEWNTTTNSTGVNGFNSNGSIAMARVRPEPSIMPYLERILREPAPARYTSYHVNSNSDSSKGINNNGIMYYLQKIIGRQPRQLVSTTSEGISSNSVKTDSSIPAAHVNPEPSIMNYLEKVIGLQHRDVVASNIPNPPALYGTTTILKTDEELEGLIDHWTEMEEMRRLQKEDGGRQTAQQKEKERKDHAAHRAWVIVRNVLISMMSVFTFLFTFVAVRAHKKRREQKSSRKDEEREVGERIELGLTQHRAAEVNVDVKDEHNNNVIVAEPVETEESKIYTERRVSVDSLSLGNDGDREVQPLDTLAVPGYREVEVVSRLAPTTGYLALPERNSSENPWSETDRRESV